MALCNITGTLYYPSGEPARTRQVWFHRAPESVAADYLGTVLPDDTRTRSAYDGSVDFNLITGYYIGEYEGTHGRITFKLTVPESASARLEDCIAAVDPVEPMPMWLVQIIAEREAAEAAATSAGVDAGRAETAANRIDLGALDDAVEATSEDRVATAADRVATGQDRGAAETAATNAAANANALIAPNVAASVAAANRSEAARDAAIAAGAWDYAPADEVALDAITGMTEGQTAFVRDTTHVWVYDGAGWVDTGESPLAVKADVAQVRALAEQISGAEDVFAVTDRLGAITLRQSADGGLYMPGLDGPVQRRLDQIIPGSGEDIFNLRDDKGADIMRVTAGGDLVLPVAPNGISAFGPQHGPASLHDQRQRLSAAASAMLAELDVIGSQRMGMAEGLLPRRYTVRADLGSDLTVVDAPEMLSIDNYYGPDMWMVHPYIVCFDGALHGHRYMMIINPYRHEAQENPFVYGSNDLRNWTPLGDGEPLDVAELAGVNWLSDSGLTYDPMDGALVCYWRYSTRDAGGGPGYTTVLRARKTWDGLTWGPIFQIAPPAHSSEEGYLSPSLLFDCDAMLWRMWLCYESAPGLLMHTAPSLSGPWTAHASPTPVPAWHAEVKYVGNRYVALLNKRDPDSNIRFAVSDDGLNWTTGDWLLPGPQDAIYKASFVPVLDGDQIAFDLIWTTNHTADPAKYRRAFYARTNFTNVE